MRHLSAISVLIAALILSLASPLKATSPQCQISFDSARLDVCSGEWQLINEDLRHLASISAFVDSSIRVVKFDRPIGPEQRSALTDLGVEILGYAPHFGYRVRMDPALDQTILQRDDVAWVGPYLPVWKVGINLANDLQSANVRTHAPDVQLLTITLQPGADRSAASNQLNAIAGLGEVSSGSSSIDEYLVMRFDPDQLERIVEEAAVIEDVAAVRFRFPNDVMNSQGVWLHQSGENDPISVPLFDQGLLGCGQTIGILDTGMRVDHCSFEDPDPNNEFPFTACADGADCPVIASTDEHRKIGAFYKWDTASGGPGDAGNHGTAVAGNALGSNWNDPLDCEAMTTPGGMTDLDGMAPGARAIVQNAGGSLQYLNDHGGNLYHAATVAFESGAFIHNNSWGSGCRTLFGCVPDCIVEYRENSRYGDLAVWENPELVIFAAAGNSGGGDGSAGCGLGADVGSPGNAKSVFGIGGNQRGALGDNTYMASSRGPASDRRTKPDIIAQSQAVMTSDSATACGTRSATGTSFGSPTAAGFGALVREYLQRGFYPLGFEVESNEIPDPSAALIRAIMTNSAVQIFGQGSGSGYPNQNIGWGRLLADNALYFDGDDRWLWLHDEKDGLETGEVHAHQVTTGADEELIVTLIWHDFPAELNADPHIVNQLRLEVETPSGDVWTQKLPPDGGLADADPFQATTETDYDDRNTVHQIMLDNPEPGTYEIRVRGIQIAMGDAQPYALAVTGDLLGIGDPDFMLQRTPSSLAVCEGTDADYDIGVFSISEFDDPVTLSITDGLPGGASFDFSVNPVTPADPAAISVLSIGDTDLVVPDTYSIELTGESDGPGHGPISKSVNLGLTVHESLGATNLIAPPDGVIDTSLMPQFEWDALSGVVDYTLQVATDSGFVDLVIDETLSDEQFTPDFELNTGTIHYWRVRGNNTCGDGEWSATFQFQTRFEPVADVTPDSFDFVLELGNVGNDVLSIGNIGTGNLNWSIETDLPEFAGASRDAHNPDLDEPVALPEFSITGGGAVVEFEVELGQLTRGDIIGFHFQGDVTGASGTSSWASDTCMVIEAPDGTFFGVGGFGTASIPGCGVENSWDFQGSGSADDGFYESEHLDAFDPPLPDQGEWTIRFVMDFGSDTLTWDNVVVTFLKQPLPVCFEDLTNVPWLSASPDSGSVPAGDSDLVTVTVDTDGMSHGEHVGYLCVTTDDANTPLIPIPVTLEVIDPGLGILQGNVSSLGICSEDGGPLEGAEVFIEGSNNTFELTTDESGNYSIMIDESESPLDITVSAELHADATASGVIIEAGETTVEDFDLAGDTACAELTPDFIEESADLGQSVQATFEIESTGTQTLEWLISFVDGGGPSFVDDQAAEAGVTGSAAAQRPVPTRDQEEQGIDLDDGMAGTAPIPSLFQGAARRSVLQDGVLLMPDSSNDRIIALDPETGDIIDLNFIPEILDVGVPVQVILHPDGQRFLLTRQAGTSGGVVEEYDLDGNFTGIFAPIGGQDPEIMQNIRGLAVHPDTGHILVAVSGVAATQNPNSVLAFAQDGELIGQFIESNAGGLDGPWAIIFRDNDVLVSDSGGDSLRVFDLDGNFVEVFTTDPNFPQQIFENDAGNILAAGFSNPAGAWEWDADGNLIDQYTVQGSLRGIFELPSGNILVTNASGVFEIDRDNNLVRTITTDVNGRMLTLAQTQDLACDTQPPSWLSVDTSGGSTNPGDSDTVTVTLDSNELEPGQYSAQICVESNDPINPVQTVDVVFNVELGQDFGVVEGDVFSLGFCDASPFAAEGADIEFVGQTQTFNATADEDGFYSIVLPVDENPYEVTASAPDHFPDTETGFTVIGGDTLTLDFDLEAEVPCIDVDPTELSTTLQTGATDTQTISVANLGTAMLNWSIDTGSLRGESNPLVGFNFTTAGAAAPDPQNWTRISSADGVLIDVPDDTGEPTDIGIAWGGVTPDGLLFLGTSTLAPDAVPQHDYDLSGMTGYGFRAGGELFIELTGLSPNADYEYWFVAYRGASNIDNVVRVSDGNVIDAFEFNQFILSTDNDGHFVINDLKSSDQQNWNDLSFATRSSSDGEITFHWQGDTQTTVIGALAIRQLVACEVPDWLEVVPLSGQVDTGAPADEIQVTFDSTGLLPGEYVTNVCIESDDPTRAVVPVTVSMEVFDPTLGTLEGTVESLGYCSDDPSALEGASVTVTGDSGAIFETTTDASGFYSLPISENESPIDILVEHPDHLPGSQSGVVIEADQTTVANFDLTLDAACATADPDALETSLVTGHASSLPLEVGNVAGGSAMIWTLETAQVPAGHRMLEPFAVGESGNDGESAADLSALIGQTLPSLSLFQPADGLMVVDCEGEPGIVIQDDGTVENGYSGNPAAGITEVRFVDRYTPEEYPAFLTGVCVAFITISGPTSQTIDIVVYDDSGAGGSPGTEIGRLTATVDVDQVSPPIPPGLQPQWNAIDLSSLDIEVGSGSVYVGVSYAPADPNYFVAADQSTDRPVGFAGGHWWNNNAQVWAPIQDGFPDYRALMVRPVLMTDPEGCDAPEAISWLSVDPDSGTIAAGDSLMVDVMLDADGLSEGVYEALLCLVSNDPVNSLIEIPVTLNVTEPDPAVLDVDPTDLAFGEVDLGDAATLSFVVSNAADPGAESMELSTLDLSGDAEFAITGGDCAVGTVLEPGENCGVEVTFTPSAFASFSGSVAVAATDGQADTVLLSGESVQDPGILDVDPTDLAFGTVIVGEDATLGFVVSNVAGPGAMGLELSTLALSGDAEFAIAGGDCAAGTVLEPGESCAVDVTFTPSDGDSYAGSILVDTTNGQSATVTLSGEGELLPAELEVDTNLLNFGQIPIDRDETLVFTVSNAAPSNAASLELSAIDLSGAAEFVITGGDCTVGTELEPSESCTVEVTFAPTAEVTSNAVVAVVTTSGDIRTVSLTGQGVELPDEVFSDRFED
jgi:hypothetical protein